MSSLIKKHIEMIKTALIIFLAVTAIILGSQTGMYSQLFSSSGLFSEISSGMSSLFFGNQQSSAGTQAAKFYSQAAKPCAVVFCSAGSGDCAAIWDADELDFEFNSFSAALGEALGSAREPALVSDAAFRAALEGDGVYFEFPSQQRLSLLAAWLGTTMNNAQSAKRLLLSANGDGAALFYIDADSGDYFRCDTELLWASVSARLGDFSADGVCFAYSLGAGYEDVDPYAIVPDAVPQKYSYTSKNPFRSSLSTDSILPAFSMNSYVATSYPETDGTTVYVEGDSTLRISPIGEATYRSSAVQNADKGSELSLAECVETAFSLVSACALLSGEESEFYLSSYTLTDGQYMLEFNYLLSGLPVVQADGAAAARVLVGTGGVTWARVLFRDYERSDSMDTLLPSTLEAAVVQADGGGSFSLVYDDDGQKAAAGWRIS